MRPLFPPLLYCGDAIRLRIKMLPATPLPSNPPVSRHLNQIISVHLAVVFGARHSPFDLRYEIPWKLGQAKKQHVTVPQSYAIMVVVRVAHLPQDAPVPVNFKGGSALPRFLANEARGVSDDLAIVE